VVVAVAPSPIGNPFLVGAQGAESDAKFNIYLLLAFEILFRDLASFCLLIELPSLKKYNVL
jgi:hypothetical protein